MSKSIIIDLEHVARKSVHAVLSACTLSSVSFSAIYVLHAKPAPVVVPLPLVEGLLKLPLHFVTIPTSISRSKDTAIYLAGYLAGCKGGLQDNDFWFVSSRATWFTAETLNCRSVSIIRTTEEIIQFSASIGVEISASCDTTTKGCVDENNGAALADNREGWSATTDATAPDTQPTITGQKASAKPKRAAKTDKTATTEAGEASDAPKPVRAKKQKRTELSDAFAVTPVM